MRFLLFPRFGPKFQIRWADAPVVRSLSLAGYSVGKCLHASSKSEVFEASREADGTEVVLKSYRADRAHDPKARACREFDLLRRIAHRGIPRALELDRSTERPVLVLERVHAMPPKPR